MASPHERTKEDSGAIQAEDKGWRMKILRVSTDSIDVRFDDDELGAIVGSLSFLYSQLPESDFETLLGVGKEFSTGLRDELGRSYRRMRSLDPAATAIGTPPNFELIVAWVTEYLNGNLPPRELYHRLWPVTEWYLFHGSTFDVPVATLDDPAGSFSNAWACLSRALRGNADSVELRRVLEESLPIMRRPVA
jgi:hypothetical protein